MNPVQAADQAIDAVIRLAKDCGIPENFSSVSEYPKTRMGQGWYEGRPTEAIQSDDEELQKMAEHMMEDLCTPGNPRDLTVEGGEGSAARLRLRLDGAQDLERLPAERLGRGAGDGPQDPGLRGAGSGPRPPAGDPVNR